ncbi:hypothetical protein AMTRI_Chr03g143720 [Amborella trichopoda]
MIFFSDLVFFFSLLISNCFVLFICYGVINVLAHFFIC